MAKRAAAAYGAYVGMPGACHAAFFHVRQSFHVCPDRAGLPIRVCPC